MPQKNLLTIKNSLLAIVTMLVTGVLFFSGMSALTAYQERLHEQQTIEMNGLSDLLLTSAGNWAEERGLTNAALGAPEPIAADRRALIDERRAAADRALSSALDGLRRGPSFPGQEEAIAGVETAFSSLQELRRAVDQALSLPKDRRDGVVISSWVPTATSLILKSRDLRVALTQAQGVDSLIGQLTSLKHFAWVMSEFAGRERAIIGGAISAGRRLDQKTLQTLNAFRGQVELAWESVQDIGRDEGLPPDVFEAIAQARSSYFETFQQTREAVQDGGTNLVAYPMSASEWVEKATVAIDSILALRESVALAWSRSGLAPEANALTQNLIEAAGNWAVERGATNAALNAEAPVSDKVRQIIDARRDSADTRFREALQQLSLGRSFAERAQSVQTVEAGYAAVVELFLVEAGV